MLFGVHFAATDETLDVREVGRIVEAAGFESLFLPEHTHLPAYGDSIHPSGPQMHARLRRFLDPFIALTAVAAVTERLRLGTGVCLIAQHDPITLAKQIATLDMLSNGRFLFGIGAGWNHEELRHHGTDPATRWRVMRERVLAMRRIWTEDRPEFHGSFVDFGPMWQWPKPVQRPHPPVLVGGEGPRVLERVLEYGDEWSPNAEPGIAERVAQLQQLAEARGRGRIPVTAMHVTPTYDEIARYAAAGVTRCVFTLSSGNRPAIEQSIARLMETIGRFTGSGPDDRGGP
jgi:probable F420-dependent oxidoreductase